MDHRVTRRELFEVVQRALLSRRIPSHIHSSLEKVRDLLRREAAWPLKGGKKNPRPRAAWKSVATSDLRGSYGDPRCERF
jgi:hypothetical protein